MCIRDSTWVVPGSHKRLVDVPDAGVEYAAAVPALGPRGSVMIMNGSIWHRSGANTSAGDRVALLGFFCRAFLKPQQDHLRLVGEEVVERAAPALRLASGGAHASLLDHELGVEQSAHFPWVG